MFRFTLVLFGAGLLALIIACITDIRTREVPDWLNYSLTSFALGSALIMSLFHGYPHIFLNALLCLGVGLVIGLLMFYTGQWGGGDSKLIIGLSALIGVGASEFAGGLPLLLIFMINILFVGAVYGIVFSIAKAAANLKVFKKAFEERLRTKQMIIIRILFLVLGLASLGFFLAVKSYEATVLFLFLVMVFLLVYLWNFISVVEKKTMIKKMRVNDLTEGDWVVRPVKKKNKIILEPSKTGVTKKQIQALKRHRIRSVAVKVGLPFVPSFLIAYVLTLMFGNWLVYLF